MKGHTHTAALAALFFSASVILTGCIPVTDADVDRDGYVDSHDLDGVRSCLNREARDQARCEAADVDHDGTISFLDLALVRLHFGAILFEPGWPEYGLDAIESDARGTLYFLYSGEQRIHRWSTRDARQLSPLVIDEHALGLAFSTTKRTLLVSHRGGPIVAIPTNDPDAAFEFARTDVTSYLSPMQMLPTRDHLIVVAPRLKTWLYSWTGELLAEYTSLDERILGSGLVWSEEAGKVFQTRSGPYVANHREDFSSHRIISVPGALVPDTMSPYDGHLGRLAPLRVDTSGNSLLAANGMIFDTATLKISTILPINYTDACWIDEMRFATLTKEGNDSLVEIWHRDGRRLDVSLVDGTPRRIFFCGWHVSVVTELSDGPRVTRVVLGLDSDRDGVPTSEDAFPLDAAAATDTDGDGYPDTWIGGRPTPPIETDLKLDAYPYSAACQLEDDGRDGVCSTAQFESFGRPRASLMDDQDVFYFLGGGDAVYRWSVSKGRMLDPIRFPGESPAALAYCRDSDRVFVAHGSRRIDVLSGPRDSDARPDSAYYATMPSTLRSSSALFVRRGNLVAMGIGSTHAEFDQSGGLRSLQFFGFPNARTTWDARHNRLFTADSTRLYRASFDPETHQWLETTEASIERARHVLVSPIGDVLLADYRVVDANSLAEIELGASAERSAWLEDGGLLHFDLVPGYSDDEASRPDASYLVHRDAERKPIARIFLGRLQGVLVATNSRVAVAMTGSFGRYEFHIYLPSNDPDLDGVPSSIDAFPEDVSASLDTDQDGYPDRWNTGYYREDSTQGLELDAFPEDWVCRTADQGRADDPSICDHDRHHPTFIARDGFVDTEGILHLEKLEKGHVYDAGRLGDGLLFRWSIEEGRFMNPIVLPRDYLDLTHSPSRRRIYLSHDRGRVSFVELSERTPRPQEVFRVPEFISDLVAIDPLLFVRSHTGVTLATLAGELTHTVSWRESFREFTWNPHFEELYGTSHRGLHVARIDLRTRRLVQLMSRPGETEHFSGEGPIRVSLDGDRFLLNDGSVYTAGTFQYLGSLGLRHLDAAFHADGSITTLRFESVSQPRTSEGRYVSPISHAIIEHWDEALRRVWMRDIVGFPKRVFVWDRSLVLVTTEDSETRIRVLSEVDGS